MHEFRPHNLRRDTHYYDREDAFGEWFSEADNDPTSALTGLVNRLGENLERIFGPDAVEPVMQTLVVTAGPQMPTWRESAEEFGNHLEWHLGQELSGLVAYAVFGMGPARHVGTGAAEGERANGVLKGEARLEKPLRTIEALLEDCPVGRWLPDDEADKLISMVTMARGRWNLDHRQNVSPEALALLGGVKMTRIRNMLSGTTPVLPRDEDGLVLYEPAAAWLAKREAFLPTSWADDDELGEDTADQTGRLLDPLFVPVARDGSIFHPGLERNGGYQVGTKDHERNVGSFEEALALLQRMDVARWRRPNPNGNWGIVAATEWRRMDRSELDALAEATTT